MDRLRPTSGPVATTSEAARRLVVNESGWIRLWLAPGLAPESEAPEEMLGAIH